MKLINEGKAGYIAIPDNEKPLLSTPEFNKKFDESFYITQDTRSISFEVSDKFKDLVTKHKLKIKLEKLDTISNWLQIIAKGRLALNKTPFISS